jgi:glycine/D-amino acid oxidase-like deaminating enzyme
VTSLWLDDAPALDVARPRQGVVDVAIVGGGVTGCAAALVLARAGKRVRLYEAREIAGGASGRNGGFALRGMPAPFDVMADSIGEERTRELWAWTEGAIDELAALGGDVLRRVGSLRIAADEDERAELRREYEGLRSAGREAEWLDDLDGPLAGRFAGAIRHPTDGALQPAAWVRHLATLAAEEGAELCEHTRLETLAEAGAPIVLVATDGYPSGLLGELEGLIVPTRGQIVATEPMLERWFEVPHYGRHGFDYWHQTPDGRIVAGGFRDASLATEFTSDEVITQPVQSALEDFVQSIAGRPLRIDYRWAGIFGMVMDFLPVVGRVPGLDGVWVAGGYSGHGNVLGFACGQLVAQAILGEDAPFLDLFEPARLLGEQIGTETTGE